MKKGQNKTPLAFATAILVAFSTTVLLQGCVGGGGGGYGGGGGGGGGGGYYRSGSPLDERGS